MSLIEAIHVAANAGFDAIECHWPFETPVASINTALTDAKLPLISLNTALGDLSAGEFGLCAIPGFETKARSVINQAIDYAAATGTQYVHVMAGKSAQIQGAMDTFMDNLSYAADLAQQHDLGILIEPINRHDVPGYFLADMETAVEIVRNLDRANLKIMFDCYHMQIIHGDLQIMLEKYLDLIGHIQIAAVPSRHEPDEGEVDYRRLLSWLDETAYEGYIGAEYKPRASTDAGLGWIDLLCR